MSTHSRHRRNVRRNCSSALLSLVVLAGLSATRPASAQAPSGAAAPSASANQELIDKLRSLHPVRTPATAAEADTSEPSAHSPVSFLAATSSVSDPAFDMTPAASDLIAVSADVGTNQKVSFTSTTYTYVNPMSDPNWNYGLTGMWWFFDINGDQDPDRYLWEYRDGNQMFARVYDADTDAFVCEGLPWLDANLKQYSGTFPISCIGGTGLASLSWVAYSVYDTPTFTNVDRAPSSGLVGPVASSVYRPKVAANTSRIVQVGGVGGVPLTGVAAVSLNVTVTSPSGAGYVTAYPCGSVPNASNLNFVSGQTVPNAVIAPVDAQGQVCLFTSADTHLIADVSGWFPVSSDFQALSPSRLLDTRGGAKLAAGTSLTLPVAGRSGIPATGNAAVVLNVTAIGADADGYLTVYPCGSVPNSSNVNFQAGSTVPNMVVAPVDASGNVCIYSSSTTHIFADVAGSFATSAAGFHALVPERRMDTRSSLGGIKLNAGETRVLNLASSSIPSSGVAAASLNVTATQSSAGGYLTVFPCGLVPNASNVNFTAGGTSATAVMAPLNASSQLCIFSSASTHVIVDVNGWFPNGDSFHSVTPARVLDTR